MNYIISLVLTHLGPRGQKDFSEKEQKNWDLQLLKEPDNEIDISFAESSTALESPTMLWYSLKR